MSRETNSTPVGKVQTVLGPVDPESLGIVLPHEHILIDLRWVFIEPEEPDKKAIAEEPVSLTNLHWVRRNGMTNRDNLALDSTTTAIEEVLHFKSAGGGSIVDMSNKGLGRDPQGLVDVALGTGLNIIMGCGYYTGISHPEALQSMGVEQIVEEMITDIQVGVDDTGIRAGVIGEIGCSNPLEPGERKVLRAAASASRRTGVPINIHPSPFGDRLALEIADILGEAGADLRRVVISHCDQFRYSLETRRSLAELGCYVEHDCLGWDMDVEFSFGEWRDLLSDMQRLNDIKTLLDWGYRDHLLLSHDICTKTRLRSRGGWGYAHILENLVPVMRAKGFSEEDLQAMMIDNPKRIFTLVEPA